MKKAIWILFIVAALIWTVFAFAAAGLARWTSDAIAMGPNSGWTQTTESVTKAVTAPMNEAVGAATAAIGTIGAGVSANIPSLPAIPTMLAMPPIPSMPPVPPVPAWVDQWLGPEWTQSLREWGAWAKAAVGVAAATVNAPATPTTPNAPDAPDAPGSATTTTPAASSSNETLRNTAAAATQAASEKATKLAEQARATAVAASPWLASVVGWLVQIVWALWGIGLLVGFISTLLLQWVVGRISGGDGSGGVNGTPSRSFS